MGIDKGLISINDKLPFLVTCLYIVKSKTRTYHAFLTEIMWELGLSLDTCAHGFMPIIWTGKDEYRRVEIWVDG